MMSIPLPKPIDIYFASENLHDPTAIDTCFDPDATVRDEHRTIEGLDAIKAWRIETGKKYNHTIEPLAIREHDGKVIVTGKVSGSFPGSPINLDHVFELKGDRIISLKIG
jgi:SnoaL-like domain